MNLLNPEILITSVLKGKLFSKNKSAVLVAELQCHITENTQNLNTTSKR